MNEGVPTPPHKTVGRGAPSNGVTSLLEIGFKRGVTPLGNRARSPSYPSIGAPQRENGAMTGRPVMLSRL
jgi:hypothetical protein